MVDSAPSSQLWGVALGKVYRAAQAVRMDDVLLSAGIKGNLSRPTYDLRLTIYDSRSQPSARALPLRAGFDRQGGRLLLAAALGLTREGLQSYAEDGVEVVYRDHLEAAPHLLGDLIEVLLVLAGQDEGSYAGSVGGEHFLFESADGEDFAAQGDLARHRYFAADFSAREGGYESGGEGDACRGAILGDSACGDVDVDVCALKSVGVNAQLASA